MLLQFWFRSTLPTFASREVSTFSICGIPVKLAFNCLASDFWRQARPVQSPSSLQQDPCLRPICFHDIQFVLDFINTGIRHLPDLVNVGFELFRCPLWLQKYRILLQELQFRIWCPWLHSDAIEPVGQFQYQIWPLKRFQVCFQARVKAGTGHVFGDRRYWLQACRCLFGGKSVKPGFNGFLSRLVSRQLHPAWMSSSLLLSIPCVVSFGCGNDFKLAFVRQGGNWPCF